MYTLSEKQIDFILNDIKTRGVEMEDLQLNLLDHICCIIECEFEPDGDFENFYQKIIPRFFKKELKEIEEETIFLLTFKHYYAMKKTMIISGTFSVVFFIIGSLFKIMHWPGTAALLLLGTILISFVFLPLMFLLKAKETHSMQSKLILTIGALVGILYCISTLFAVMHWPGGRILWITTVGISGGVLIPLYFFTGIRKAETKVNTIVTTILLVGATSLLFMMINIRPTVKLTQIKMYSYVQGEELLQKIQHKQTDTINDKLVSEINAKCEHIKSLILQNAIGEPSIPKDFETKDIIMEEGNLSQEFFDDGPGIKLLIDLKEEINKYNSSGIASKENKIPVEHSILDIEFDKIGRYSNYSVLNSITQLQMFLATTDNKLTASK